MSKLAEILKGMEESAQARPYPGKVSRRLQRGLIVIMEHNPISGRLRLTMHRSGGVAPSVSEEHTVQRALGDIVIQGLGGWDRDEASRTSQLIYLRSPMLIVT